MMKTLAASLALLPVLATVAHADGTETTNANTVVVVTPNAPVIVSGNGAQAAAPAPSVEAPIAPPSAQPVAMTAGGVPAPQNEEWNNVSHINGQVVPVGERGAYLYKAPKTNVNIDPFGIFWGFYDGAVTHAISQNVALSVGFTIYSGDNGNSDSFYQFNASAPIYFKRTFSGPYLEPGIVSRTTTSANYYDACGGCSGSNMSTTSSVGFETLFGWSWIFDSGLNVALAGGPVKMFDGSSHTSGNGYFRVGYAF